jgi:hypothetical protein
VNVVAEHEKETLRFIQPEQKRRYLIDFTFPAHPALVLEVKGRFTASDRKKMLLVKEQHPDRQVIMLFGKAKNTLTKKSTTTYGDWCDKNEIAWCDLETFKENPNCLFTLIPKKAGLSKSPQRRKKKPSEK